MTSPATVQATFCATLVDEWVRCGIRHAVLSPGSRSTPLALALAAEERLQLHVHHDERAAAFLALGIGLATGVPAVVVTTSGTAAVELHPAVVEASQAAVPMVVCTADRPPELQSVGAAQTVDQSHLYGRAVRWFADPGVADDAVRGTWRSLAARAATEALGPRPGPVHLNLAFREPLVADPADVPAGRPDGSPWHRSIASGEVAPAELPGGRGVLVAGGGIADPAAVLALGRQLGWPVLADPRSGCRGRESVAAFDALLRAEGFAAAHRPDVVVRLGDAPASKVLAQWVASSGAQEWVVAGRWLDPERTAGTVVRAEPGAWCRAATGAPAEESWRRSWTEAEGRAQAAIAATLAGREEVTEPFVARTTTEACTGSLVVASSMPVRDVEWYGTPRTDLRVLANRGANGIDGVVSTAVGVAAASGPTTVLLGDVAFLHDTNALLGLAERELHLRIVVIDNRGGGIFEFLPQARELPRERFEQLFGTPHDVDLAGLAAAHGIATTTVRTPADLAPALQAPVGTSVVLVPTDRRANVEVHEQLHAAVAAAL